MKACFLLVALCISCTATTWAARSPGRGWSNDPDVYTVHPLGAYPPPPSHAFPPSPSPSASPSFPPAGYDQIPYQDSNQNYRFRETAAHAARSQFQSQRDKEEEERDSLEFSSRASAGVSSLMMVKNKRCPNGAQYLKCPFSSGTCCGNPGYSQACCPVGYGCAQRAAGWHCVHGDPSTSNTPASRPVTSISPTIVVTNGAPSTSASTAGSSSGADSDADDSAGTDGSDGASTPIKRSSLAAPSSASSSGDDSFKPKQNIIIVKNINVLTKGVAPASSLGNKSTDS